MSFEALLPKRLQTSKIIKNCLFIWNNTLYAFVFYLKMLPGFLKIKSHRVILVKNFFEFCLRLFLVVYNSFICKRRPYSWTWCHQHEVISCISLIGKIITGWHSPKRENNILLKFWSTNLVTCGKKDKFKVLLFCIFMSKPKPVTLLKKRLQYRRFPVNIAKFLKPPILKNICERLFLEFDNVSQLKRTLFIKNTS